MTLSYLHFSEMQAEYFSMKDYVFTRHTYTK